MPNQKSRVTHKHFRLDAVKISRVRKALRASTETEAIDRALDLALEEHQRNKLASQAHERFVKSGVVVRDVYRKLGSAS
ncbi:MAG: hypothetical protein WCC27_04110 [Acidobacteriaceae bacterium]